MNPNLLCREQMDLLMLNVASKFQDSGRSLEDAFPDDAARVTSSELTAFLEEAGVANAAETADKLVSSFFFHVWTLFCLRRSIV